MRPIELRILANRAFLLGLALGCFACSTPNEDDGETGQPPSDEAVLATYDDGQVTREDVDQTILELQPAMRQPGPEQSRAQWFESLIEEIVIDRGLAREAELLGVSEEPELVSLKREAWRQAVVEVYLERNRLSITPVTREDVLAEFQNRRVELTQPARRMVSHIFKRRREGEPLEAVKNEIAELRERVLAGEPFAKLATEHSDSETRHQEGRMGWLSRTNTPPALAEVIFSLEERRPSAPVVTTEGVHLFWVDQAIEERSYEFNEVERNIARELEAARRDDAMVRWAEGLEPLPEDFFVASREELASLLQGGDSQAIVLRIDDHEISVGRFESLLRQSADPRGAMKDPTVASSLLETLVRRERIYRHAEKGLGQDPEVIERSEARVRDSLLRTMRLRRVRSWLGAQPDVLQAFYESNASRFSSPLRFDLKRLTVSAESRSLPSVMQELEYAAAQGNERPSLDELAAAVGGKIDALGWKTIAELAKMNPRWVFMVGGLKTGQLSAPLSASSVLESLEVVERQEPEPVPFASIQERVRSVYLEEHGQELYESWKKNSLEEAHLKVFTERLPVAPKPPEDDDADRDSEESKST